MTPPAVKILLSAVLYGGVVALAVVPQGAELLGSVFLVALILVVVGVLGAGWVAGKLRLERTRREDLRAEQAARSKASGEISWLEELHSLPASEPNRSAHVRTSERS